MSYSSHQNPYYQSYSQYQQIPMQPQSNYISYIQPATYSNHNSSIEQFPRPSVRETGKASNLYFNESDEEINRKKRETSRRVKEQKPTTKSKTKRISSKLTQKNNNSSSEHEYRPIYSPDHHEHYVMMPPKPIGVEKINEERMRKELVPVDQPENEPEGPIPELNLPLGIRLNQEKISEWQGELDNHSLKVDPNPEVIERTIPVPIEYNQDIFYKFFQYFANIQDGDITIKQEPYKDVIAPPLIVRIPGAEGCIKDPVIIREKIITDTREPLPPVDISVPGEINYLPRKVIIEKFDKKPTRPSTVYIFKWLQYINEQRKVNYVPAKKPAPPDWHNLEIHWKYLQGLDKPIAKLYGICEHENPKGYLERYADTLVEVDSHAYGHIPYQHLVPEEIKRPASLTGSDEALERFRKLDLDTLERHGLLNYRHYLSTPVQ